MILEKIIFTSLLFFSLTVNASQPMGGWKRNIEVEGAPLTITWQNEQIRPKLVTWMQDIGIPIPYSVASDDIKLIIPRKGINSIPEKLLIIPDDNRFKPTVINVSPEAREILYNPEIVPQNEVWFWGITPPNPCPPPSGIASMSINVRLIHKKEIYANLHGAFVWHINLDKQDKYEIPFYFLPDMENMLSLICIEGFSKASDISQSLCFVHHGGECVFTAETNNSVWGKTYQIKFEENKQFNHYDCPLY